MTRKIVDPSNSNNIISNDKNITPQEKQYAKKVAENSLKLMDDDWRKVIW